MLYILNGPEHYRVDEVGLKGDSLTIIMPLFGSTFKLHIEGEKLTGFMERSAYTMPFKAVKGVKGRFDQTHTPSGKGEGRWKIKLNERELIGEFVENDSTIVGSFLTATGDYRYFEGVLTQSGHLSLSSFDGGFIRLFQAQSDSNRLSNIKLYTGFNKVEEGEGVRESNAQLQDPYSITTVNESEGKFTFSFPTIEGEMLSFPKGEGENPVTIVQISGSWCPNCLDESRFLDELYRHYRPKVDILAIAFERSKEFEIASKEASKLVRVAKISYPVLISGYTPREVEIALPQLKNFRAFPTTIVIDKRGEVQRVHSGFNGPGTGIHYNNFKEEFYSFIDRLIEE